ncbi:PPID [Symbiodinium sp. KB8]|nr:PPID [Symbiodinium sp. KB8]
MSRNRSCPEAMLACSASRSLCSNWPWVLEQWEDPKTPNPESKLQKFREFSSEASEEPSAEASEQAPAEEPALPEAELTYAWQQTDAEVKVYVSFDQAEDLFDVTESQVQSEFGEWSASLLINVDRGALGFRV